MNPKTRLNKNLRNTIVNRALAHAKIEEKEAQLNQDYSDWCHKVTARYYTDEVQSIVKEIERLQTLVPLSLIEKTFAVRRCATMWLTVAGQHRSFTLRLRDGKPDYKAVSSNPTLSSTDPLTQELYDLDDRHEKLVKLRSDITVSVRAAVNACKNIDELIRTWPEAEILLEQIEPKKEIVALPAVKAEELNKLVGLP